MEIFKNVSGREEAINRYKVENEYLVVNGPVTAKHGYILLTGRTLYRTQGQE